MLGAFAFLIALVTPLIAFGLIMLRVKKWPFRKLRPYVVAYFAIIGGLLGLGFRLRGWDWVVGVVIAMVVAWLGMTSWTYAVEHAEQINKK